MPRKKKNLDNFNIKGDVGDNKEDLDKKGNQKEELDVKSGSNIKEKKVKKTAVKKSDKKSNNKSQIGF